MIISTGLKKLIEMRNEFEVVAVVADCFHCLERINHLNRILSLLTFGRGIEETATSGRVV